MAKVIKVDNHGRENISDVLIKDNLTDKEAIELAKKLNAPLHMDSLIYYRHVNDDYKLWDATSLY